MTLEHLAVSFKNLVSQTNWQWREKKKLACPQCARSSSRGILSETHMPLLNKIQTSV